MASRSGKSSKTDQLLEAVSAGDLRRMKKLAREMDDGKGMAETLANAKDLIGRGVLHVAAGEGRTDICKYLIEELKFHVDEKDGEGRVRTAVYLIENGANPATLNRYNVTALHIAAGKDSDLTGTIKMIKLLLSKGIDVNAPSDMGTPLQVAAKVCKQDVLKILLDHGANPNLAVSLIPTPLMRSITANSLPCTKLLIQAGASPNAVFQGSPPLAIAARDGKLDVIKCLLEAGADPNIMDSTGLNPLEIAARNANLLKLDFFFLLPLPFRHAQTGASME